MHTVYGYYGESLLMRSSFCHILGATSDIFRRLLWRGLRSRRICSRTGQLDLREGPRR